MRLEGLEFLEKCEEILSETGIDKHFLNSTSETEAMENRKQYWHTGLHGLKKVLNSKGNSHQSASKE